MLQYGGKCAAALASLLLAGPACAEVTVNYVNPEKFADLPRAPYQRRQALDDFAAHFRELGKSLPPGMDVAIDVLDIDLAGREQPNRFGSDELRVMHGGADWPRMHLRYALSEHGKVVASGDAQLSDMSYTDDINSYPRDARWPYEMQMIDDWWRKTIAPLAGTKR
jgi:hypothetical protein